MLRNIVFFLFCIVIMRLLFVLFLVIIFFVYEVLKWIDNECKDYFFILYNYVKNNRINKIEFNGYVILCYVLIEIYFNKFFFLFSWWGLLKILFVLLFCWNEF